MARINFTTSLVAGLGLTLLTASAAFAGPKNFHKGAVFTEFGEIASVEADMKIP